LFRITDIAQYDNKNMNSEQDTPGSSQALMVAFEKKITEIYIQLYSPVAQVVRKNKTTIIIIINVASPN